MGWVGLAVMVSINLIIYIVVYWAFFKSIGEEELQENTTTMRKAMHEKFPWLKPKE